MKRIIFFEGWAIPQPVFMVLAIASIMEVVEVTFGFPPILTIGFVALPWAIVPCLLALMLIIQYRHRPRIVIGEPRALAYVSLLAMGFVFGSLYVLSNGYGVSFAIVVAVSVEEVVYRLALPVVISLIVMKFGLRARQALFLAIAISTVLFAVMPGHLTQLHNVRSYAAFVAFSILMSHAVWRGRSLFAPIVAHAVYDFANIGMQHGDISSSLRVLGAAATLLSLVVIAAHPKIRVIDLRETTKTPVIDREGDQSQTGVLTRH